MKFGILAAGLSKFGSEILVAIRGIVNPPKGTDEETGILGDYFGASIFKRSFLLKSVIKENEAYLVLSPSTVSLNLEYCD